MVYTLSFATALLTSFGLTPLVCRLALYIGLVDNPGPRKIHKTPMPLLGGLAIYTAAVLAIIAFVDGSARTQVFGILSGATLLLLVGILDDRGFLHHQIKLLIAMPLAAVILIASGVRITPFIGIFGTLLSIFATLFWVVGITAAFSILDHMDGLCAGITAIASLFFFILAVHNGQVLVSTLAAAMLGASLGFLRWNFNPARIFMGDGGAMFLGFMMATLGIKLRFPGLSQTTSWLIPILILGIPIFDTTLVTVSRARRGLIPFASPGKDHTAHRLANLGLGQKRAVMVLYMGGIFVGLVALLISRLSSWYAYKVVGVIVAGALLAIVALERAPFER